jgi:hypothetical protein
MLSIEQRSLLLANLRAIGNGEGGTANICKQAAEQLLEAWKQLDCLEPEDGSVAAVKYRAESNGLSCKEFADRFAKIKMMADEALRMPWLIDKTGG